MAGIVFYVPETVATTPAEGHCYVNSYWTVHPEKGLAFYASAKRPIGLDPWEEDEPSPQCNKDEYTARALQQKIYPDCETKLIPVVYLQHAIAEMYKVRKELARKRAAEQSAA